MDAPQPLAVNKETEPTMNPLNRIIERAGEAGCPIKKALSHPTLGDQLAQALQLHDDNKNVTYALIAEEFGKENLTVSSYGLSKHVRGTCSCRD
jgi:hypothetical protein